VHFLWWELDFDAGGVGGGGFAPAALVFCANTDFDQSSKLVFILSRPELPHLHPTIRHFPRPRRHRRTTILPSNPRAIPILHLQHVEAYLLRSPNRRPPPRENYLISALNFVDFDVYRSWCFGKASQHHLRHIRPAASTIFVINSNPIIIRLIVFSISQRHP
jgi:hypothetical protein